jgi:protein arginine kinase
MNLSSAEQDIVLSSRIRLARNLNNFKFMSSLSEPERRELEKVLYSVFIKSACLENFSIYNINDLDELDRIVLKEKKIISQRFYRQGEGLVATDESQTVSVISGDLDHLRISAVMDGLNLISVYDKTIAIERELSEVLDFASTEKEGYLTANVSDSGTAMKGSVFLHLPVLDAFDLMNQYIIKTLETMLEVTGFSGGGSHSLGGLYLISNKNSFYPDEDSIVGLLNKTAKVFIDREREEREELVNGKYPQLEDKIYRSLGVLKYCRQITELEAISALSMLRLGISVNWINDLTFKDISSVLTCIGSGYLRSASYEEKPDETDIMRLRAETIRNKLNL